MTKRAEWAFRFVCLLVLLFLLLPTLIIVPMSLSPDNYLRFPPPGLSLRWYRTFLLDPDWIQACLFSLEIATLTTVASVVVGTAAAIALVRGQLPGRSIVEALLLAPLIVPPIIVAIAVYLQFAPLGLIGTIPGFVLIHTALAVPYVVLVVSAALQRLPPSLELAGLNLGASRLTCFRRIVLPLIAPSVLAGAVFAFLASFDETVISFFISGTEHKTVTRKMFEDIEFNLSPVIAAASSLFIAVTLLLMLLANASKAAGSRRKSETA